MIGIGHLPVVDTGPFNFRGKRPASGKRPGGFHGWLYRVTPNWVWDWDYQVFIQQHLDNLTERGEQLMLFMPPRHGKSEMVTVRYAAWRIERDPKTRIIVGAYNQTLAEKFSRKIRRIVTSRGIVLSTERHAAEDWETVAGGGVRAVGVGGGVTGMGADLVIIDDPVKNREEANSSTYRDKTYDWYTDDLFTRREPNASMILIMTRWHEDDLAGRILASEDGANWTVIKLPAEAEDGDPLGRAVGAPLCPERYDKAALAKIKSVLQKSYWALYQQRPQEQEGNIFKRSWFGFVDDVPAGAKRVRYWDKAATANDGDYTVGVLMAQAATDFIIEDVVRGQWSSGERDKVMRETAERDGKSVKIYWEEEGGSSGKDSSAALYKLLVGYTCHHDRVSGDKVTRAGPFASQCEGGNVKLKRARWNEAYLDELTSFDSGKNDDQVDGSSGAFNKLSSIGEAQVIDDPFTGW